MRFISYALICLFPLLGWTAEIPQAVVPAGVGANIHFVTGHEEDLDLIAAAGIKFIRMDFQWSGIERRKGEYDWAGYEELLANLEKRGMRAILILDYSNPLYEETVTSPNPLSGVPHKTTASPQHPESVAAFARWAAAAARRFTGRHVLWEIWNEPNGDFWAPKPDVQQYSALAVASAKAMRAADRSATIIGPATSGFPWEFLETFLKSGVLEYLDAVSVHPYRDPRQPPETAAADYHRLRSLIDSCSTTSKGNPLPILSGEWGYSTFNRGVSLEIQADYAARQQLANLLEGVPLSIWYDWKNDGNDPKENEHNFGLVLPDLKPKPAYLAVRTLTRELSGYRILRRLKLPSEKDYALVFVNAAGNQKLVAWTSAEPRSVSFAADVKAEPQPKGVTRNGDAFVPKVASGNLMVELGPSPQYIAADGANFK